MATTISIEDLGNGKYKITDSDQQTRVVGNSIAIQEAGKSGVKIQKAGSASALPGGFNQKDSTGFTNNAAGQNYPEGTPTVIVNGKTVSVTDAINQARSAKNLGLIRKNLLDSQQLTKAEAKDPNNLLDKWSQIVYGASQDPDPANKDPFKYAQSLQAQGFASTAGVQTYEPFAQQSIWNTDQAKTFVNQQYQQNLHRLPTAAELSKDSADLLKEQKKASSVSKTTYKIINGIRTQVTTKGFDEQGWIDKKLQKTPEYQTIQNQITTAANQQLSGIAAANGLTLSPQQMSEFGKRIAAGENPEAIKAIIRNQAALGQPENVKKLLGQGLDLADVYSPYKSAMAKTLEVDPNAITLDDPTLRSAFTSTGEQTLYDFQRSLRKDPRWQYTNNAREDVSNSVTKVLQDFGFVG
jgi:hypothetical protein